MPFPITPPVEPMLAKIAEQLPPDGDFTGTPVVADGRVVIQNVDHALSRHCSLHGQEPPG